MRGEYTKRKLKKLKKRLVDKRNLFCRNVKRSIVRTAIKNKNFTVISNNCWAGRVYQYLDMPYLSPTVGLYFFSPDYIKFVSDLRHYLELPLVFIDAEESRYFSELKRKNQTDKPIGLLGDVEIVFLHYKSREEALEKWNRRKARVNFDNIILKFSWSNLCGDEQLEAFDKLPFENKLMLVDKSRRDKYNCGIYWHGEADENGIIIDTTPFPGNLSLRRILNKSAKEYPEKGLK